MLFRSAALLAYCFIPIQLAAAQVPQACAERFWVVAQDHINKNKSLNPLIVNALWWLSLRRKLPIQLFVIDDAICYYSFLCSMFDGVIATVDMFDGFHPFRWVSPTADIYCPFRAFLVFFISKRGPLSILTEKFIKIVVLTLRVKEKSVLSVCYKYFEPDGSIRHELNEPLGSKCL